MLPTFLSCSIGSVLCPQSSLVPQVTTFSAQIILFDLDIPITAGTPVELYHHSENLPANVSKLINTLDRATGAIIKNNPRSVLAPLALAAFFCH